MIYGISGKTGGGKSYEAVVRHIIPTVTEQKRKVVTNLPLNVDHFCAVYGEYCRSLIEVIDGEFHNYGGQRPFSKKDHYLQYQDWQNESGQRVYFFIDECHLALPQSGTEKEVKEFYSMHRHYGFDIMLITQNFRKVDRDIRDLITNHYRAIKKSFLGQDDKYILKVHDGAASSVQSVVATHEREYESKYFKFYQSHTKSAQAVQEASSNDIKKWYDNWYFKGAIIMIVLFVFMLWSGFNKQAEIDAKREKIIAGQSLQTQTPAPENAVIVNGQRQEPTQVQPQSRKTEPKKAEHPFYKVQLHIGGWAEYSDRGRIKKDYHITASQNGQYVFEMNIRDLFLAGYQVVVRSTCLIEIAFEDIYHDYLTCDSPRVNIDTPISEEPSES